MKNKGQWGIGGVALVVIVIGAFFVFFLGFDTVDASHIGVRNRFGVIQGTMMPGMRWTGLFVHVEQYDLRLRKQQIEMLEAEKTAVDKDGQTIRARIEVNYRLNPDNVINAYTKIGRNNDLATILNIEGIIREGFKTATARYRSEEIWQKRGEVKQEAIEIITENFPADYFVLENVIISDLDFNPDFIAAIEQQKTNERLALAKEQEVEIAKHEAQRKIEETRGTAESRKITAEAEAYQKLQIAKAEAEALALKKKQLTALMVQNNYIDKWNGVLPQYMLGDSTNLLMQMPTGG